MRKLFGIFWLTAVASLLPFHGGSVCAIEPPVAMATGTGWGYPDGPAERLSLPGLNAEAPAVAMTAGGAAVVVWSQFDGSNWRLFKREYSGQRWYGPVSPDEVLSPPGSDARNPRVAMGNNGDTVIVWEQGGGRRQVFMAERRQGKWLLPSRQISPGQSNAWEGDVAVNSKGEAVVVWSQEGEGGAHAIYLSEYVHGKWRHPVGVADFISPPQVGDALRPRVAMNGAGEVLVAWEQEIEGISRIYMSERRQGRWAHPVKGDEQISPSSGTAIGGAYRPQVALNEQGVAAIVWQQQYGLGGKVYLSERRDGVWRHPVSPAESLNPPELQVVSVNSLGIDEQGNLAVLWSNLRERRQSLYLSQFRNGAWHHPGAKEAFVGPRNDWEFRAAGKVACADGKVVSVWWQYGDDSERGIFLALSSRDGWAMPVRPLSGTSGRAADSVAVAGGAGGYQVVWRQREGNDWLIMGTHLNSVAASVSD